MDTHLLKKELELAGYPGVTSLVVEPCRIDADARGNLFYPRDHQLGILRGRLRGCERHDETKKMAALLRQWIAVFESLPPRDANLLLAGKVCGRTTFRAQHGRQDRSNISTRLKNETLHVREFAAFAHGQQRFRNVRTLLPEGPCDASAAREGQGQVLQVAPGA